MHTRKKHNQPVQQVEPHAIMNSHVTKLSYVLIKYGKKYLSMITDDINITVMWFLAFKLLTLPEVCWCSNNNKIYRILGTYVNIQELFGLQKVHFHRAARMHVKRHWWNKKLSPSLIMDWYGPKLPWNWTSWPQNWQVSLANTEKFYFFSLSI